LIFSLFLIFSAIFGLEVLTEGLGHPEGPDCLPDGRIVFVNSYASEVAVWDRRRGRGTYARTGGAPNACVLGSDGNLYVTQCPTIGEWVAPDKRPPSIQRATPDGKVEIIATQADGRKFTAPNDLTFGPDGSLYFTDSGYADPVNRPHRGYICVIERNGTAHILEELDRVYPNGIVAEPDGSIVWVESYPRNLVRRRPDGSKALLHRFPEKHAPDGFKIDADGNFWVTSYTSGGVDVLDKDGAHLGFLETGGVPLNCTFGGTALFVCDFGTCDLGASTKTSGRLLKVDTGIAGMAPYRGAIS
jgi:gluconolactonase